MSAGAWGYAAGSGLIMFVAFLIFLGLLALIPPLRQRYGLRNILAWLLGSLAIGYLSGKGGASFDLLFVASMVSAAIVGLRYWIITRKRKQKTVGP